MAGGISNANDPFTRSKKETYDGFMRFAVVGTVIVIAIVIALGLITL